MVRDTQTLDRRRFGRADVETAIDLNRIVVDDFAAEGGGERQGESALAATRWTGHGDYWKWIKRQGFGNLGGPAGILLSALY